MTLRRRAGDLATTYWAAGHDHWNQRRGLLLSSVHQRNPRMSSPRDCLRRADDAKQRAAQAKEPFYKSAYERVAEYWMLLARLPCFAAGDRDRECFAIGHSELDNIGAVSLRSEDHDTVPCRWWSSLAPFKPIKEQSTLPLKRAKTFLQRLQRCLRHFRGRPR